MTFSWTTDLEEKNIHLQYDFHNTDHKTSYVRYSNTFQRWDSLTLEMVEVPGTEIVVYFKVQP